MTVRVEPETPALAPAIRLLLLEAFPTSLEADLVDRLRGDRDIEIGIVAREADAAIGYAAFSPLMAPMRALGLAPLAIAPHRQGRGIGGAVVRAGLARARASGWQAVFVLGDPAYYARFGFDAAAASGFASPYAGPHFMALSLNASALPVRTGRVDYAAAFRDLE